MTGRSRREGGAALADLEERGQLDQRRTPTLAVTATDAEQEQSCDEKRSGLQEAPTRLGSLRP